MDARVARRRERAAGLVYGAVILAITGLMVLLLIPHVFSQTLTPAMQEYVDVVVLEGDTLWHIARRFTPPGQDTRRMVDVIRSVNGLESAVVRPGQVLKVPVP